MVVREHPSVSPSRQCRLLWIRRSSLYCEPKGESAETLALMRRIDELFLKYPFCGVRQMIRHLRREGCGSGAAGPPTDAPSGSSDGLSGAADQHAAPRAPGLPVSAARSGDRAPGSCLLRRHLPASRLRCQPETAQAHREGIRLDNDHRRAGQDLPSRARPGGLDVHPDHHRLLPSQAAKTARRGADMMPVIRIPPPTPAAGGPRTPIRPAYNLGNGPNLRIRRCMPVFQRPVTVTA